jgi:hypothetical protein
MNMEQWGYDDDKEKPTYRREVCPSSTFSDRISTWTTPKMNSNKRGDKPANNLNYGVASSLNVL